MTSSPRTPPDVQEDYIDERDMFPRGFPEIPSNLAKEVKKDMIIQFYTEQMKKVNKWTIQECRSAEFAFKKCLLYEWNWRCISPFQEYQSCFNLKKESIERKGKQWLQESIQLIEKVEE